MALMQLEDRAMPLTDHLEELRRRLIVSLIVLGLGTALVWNWSGQLMSWLAQPAGGLVFLAPTEAFFTRLKVSLFGGLLVSLPILLHQAWAFTARAVTDRLRRSVLLALPVSYFLFLAGVALSVFVVVPAALKFLIAYGSSDVRPMLTVGTYVDFVTSLSVAFGVVFQLPLVLLLLNRAGLITRGQLAAKRRYVYLGSFIAAAMLTPGPDMVSQVALAVPMILLFELSLLAMLWTHRKSG
jgi:sec-independent protein translocase protein TatC